MDAEAPLNGLPATPDSPLFAAARAFDTMNTVLAGARRATALAESLQAQSALMMWQAMVLDEQARGRTVEPGGVQERAFAVHLAAEFKLSQRAALDLVRDGQRLQTHLPQSWGGFTSGAFSWRSAVAVADHAADLPEAVLPEYDRRAAELAADEPPHRLEVFLEKLRTELDPEGAAERALRAADKRTVRAALRKDGQAGLSGRGPQTDVAAMYDVLRRAAVDVKGRKGETRTVGAIMFDLLTDLVLHGMAKPPCDVTDPATPTERLGDVRCPERKAIAAELLVLVKAETATGVSEQPASLAGWGDLPAADARRLVGHTKFWTRVLVDPIDDAILGIDSTERYIPTGLRKLLWARDGSCQGPWCNHPSNRGDLDHIHRFEHDGHTTEVNLLSLCRSQHIQKDAGYLDVERLPDGRTRWRTHWGGTVVTRSLRVVRRPGAATGDARSGAPPA